MRDGTRLLKPRQRRLAWAGFVLVSAYAPVQAMVLPDASWLFSICVAGLVAAVIIADDASERAAAAVDPGKRR
ncbi:hypothetical protein [Pilimelia columellifera]